MSKQFIGKGSTLAGQVRAACRILPWSPWSSGPFRPIWHMIHALEKMFFDILFVNTATGILQYHHRVNTFFTDSPMKPHSLCMILRSITQASMEVFEQALLYMELSSTAISIYNAQPITCIVIHEISDRDCYGSMLSEAFVSLYKNVIQNSFTRIQQVSPPVTQSQVNSKLVEYMQLALSIVLDKICCMKYTASCYVMILDHPYSPVFPPGIIMGRTKHLPPRPNPPEFNPKTMGTSIGNLIDQINETLEVIFASSDGGAVADNPNSKLSSRLSTFELCYDMSFRIRVTNVFPGAYLVLMQNKRTRQHSSLHQDNATMSIMTQESVLELSAQVSTLTTTPFHGKSGTVRFEKNKFMVSQLTHAIVRIFDSAHQIRQRNNI